MRAGFDAIRGERVVGVISDTHGLVRPEATEALRGSELIVHAGDIGGPEVLDALRALAPVVAVRGNNDTDGWGRTLRDTEVVEVGDVHLYVLERKGVLYLNPGSAGPRRFTLPIAVARLHVTGSSLSAEIIELSTRRMPG